MFDFIMVLSLVLIAISILFNVYRIVIGPYPSDRILALDTLGVNLIAGIAILSILLRTSAFFDLILLIGILAFVGTIAFARHIERGVVIERKR